MEKYFEIWLPYTATRRIEVYPDFFPGGGKFVSNGLKNEKKHVQSGKKSEYKYEEMHP